MNLKSTITIMACVFALSCPAAGATDAGSGTGFLANKATVQKWSDERTDIDKNFHNYEVRAASGLEAVRSGYVIYANGQWLNLEQENRELIANLLRQTSKKKSLYVLVSGTLDGQTIHVNRIHEINEAPIYQVKWPNKTLVPPAH